MRNTFYYSLCLALLAGAAVACSKTDPEDVVRFEKSSISFTARILDTKTALVDGIKSYWTPSDKIVVYDGTNTNAIFGNSLSDNAEVASFTHESGTFDEDAAEFRAVYPDATVGGWKDGNPTFTVPNTQTAVCNGIADGLDVLMAKSTTRAFEFVHACAALKFTIGAYSASVKRVEVTSSVAFAGRWRYLFTDFKTDTDGGRTRDDGNTITFKKEDDSVFEEGSYHIMIPARNYSAGLEVKFIKSDDTEVVIQTPGVDARLKEGTFYDMGVVNSLTMLPSTPVLGEICADGVCVHVRDAHSALVMSKDEVSGKTFEQAEAWISEKGGDWRLPTNVEFVNIRASITGSSSFSAETSYNNFESFNAGISDPEYLELDYTNAYWTGTPAAAGSAYYFKFFNSSKTAFSGYESGKNTSNRKVRAVKIVYF